MSITTQTIQVLLLTFDKKCFTWYATVFHGIDEEVVSSCLLQYKPVCVINFDKLCRKMVKRSLVIFLV